MTLSISITAHFSIFLSEIVIIMIVPIEKNNEILLDNHQVLLLTK